MDDIIKIIGKDFCQCIERFNSTDTHIESNILMDEKELDKNIERQIKRAMVIADRFKILESEYRRLVKDYKRDIYYLKRMQEIELNEEELGTSGIWDLKEFSKIIK